MDVNKNLSKFLDIEETAVVQKNIIDVNQGSTGAATEDYAYTRENLKKLIDMGSVGLEGILKVANESDSPRAYEVLATTLKTLAEINVNLMDVSSKHAQATKTNINHQTNNSIFVGTTKDLQSLLKKNKKPLESEIIDVTETKLPDKQQS
jgi:aspartyl/asparaginyl-tRNA synthetase